METKLEQIAVKARREPNLRFTSLAHHITRPGAGEFIKDSEAIPRRARRNPRPYRDRTGRSPLWGADQLRSGSPARTRSRRSIQHSRSYSARSMSAATRCSHCRAWRSAAVRRTSYAAPRQDCRVGNGAELTTSRCDNLMMLALRDFERPCAWREAESGRRWTFKSEHRGT